jgi:5'-nucleotidase
MRALVTNDDGISAPGLAVLARAAADAGLEVVVAAPAVQSSGASAAITSVRREGRTPVRRMEVPGLPGVPAFAVEAQPGHIVLAGLRGWLDPVPDLVLSGINHGANVGRAVLHSGTVGAVLTAGINGVRGLAVSLDVGLTAPGSAGEGAPGDDRHWDAAASLLPRVLDLLLDAAAGTVLSLNVPNRPADTHRELRHAALAEFGAVQARVDEADDGAWRLGEIEVSETPEEGTDSALLAAGHPTLTALASVQEDRDALVPQWIAAAGRRTAGDDPAR